ncbi:MAG: helix-turn-helix transcriptional regulator [Chlamydiia bacterium]|nr:helix-turn-helix transcriptional regulator [Chlamydiia bacterium]
MKEYLFRNNLTVKEFAFQLGISASYLYQLIKRERKPSLKLAQKIEKITQGAVDLNQLINGEPPVGLLDFEDIYGDNNSQNFQKRLLEIENKFILYNKRLSLIEKRILKLENNKKDNFN